MNTTESKEVSRNEIELRQKSFFNNLLVVKSDTSHNSNVPERYVRANDEAAGASRQWGQLPIVGAPSGDVRYLRNPDGPASMYCGRSRPNLGRSRLGKAAAHRSVWKARSPRSAEDPLFYLPTGARRGRMGRALGGHVEHCEDCAHERVAYNSCRNSHCPKCRGAAARQWLEDREAELLPVPYYHVVFTLPAAIVTIALHNKAAIYGRFRPFRTFSSTRRTVEVSLRSGRSLMVDQSRLGWAFSPNTNVDRATGLPAAGARLSRQAM